MLNNPEIGFVIMVGVVATIALSRLEGRATCGLSRPA